MNARARSLVVLLPVLASLALVGACHRSPPARHYQLEGQVLAVDRDKQELTIKHGDIAGLMPAMTMSYPVASPDLLTGREPGETITATLELTDETGKLISITHTGSAPLPVGTNEVAMASGLLDVGDAVPDSAFIDQNNRRRSFSEWKGSLTLVTFIYTACPLPNFCPLITQKFANVQRMGLADEKLKSHFKLVSISFDPAHDTPAVLTTYAKEHQANPSIWTFLTGDQATIDRFAGRFGVGVLRTDGQTEITHNLRTMLIGADGKILKVYSGSDWTPDQVVTDMRAALTAS